MLKFVSFVCFLQDNTETLGWIALGFFWFFICIYYIRELQANVDASVSIFKWICGGSCCCSKNDDTKSKIEHDFRPETVFMTPTQNTTETELESEKTLSKEIP